MLDVTCPSQMSCFGIYVDKLNSFFTQLFFVIIIKYEQDAMRSHNIITRQDWGQGFVLVMNRLRCCRVSHADACGLRGEELRSYVSRGWRGQAMFRPGGVIIVRNAVGGADQ